VSVEPAPFVIRRPTVTPLPLVVSIPHTGTLLPEPTARRLISQEMAAQPMTDWHLHDLYDFLPQVGVTTIHAVYSRFVVDLNRPPDGRPLYPGRFETGLVPLETFQGDPIFSDPPTGKEMPGLRDDFHAPYHAALERLLEEQLADRRSVVLVDAHSVASGANRLHGELNSEIYLGDRDGRSGAAWLRDCLRTAFEVEGYAVSINDPYKGGFITDHYGRTDGVDAIQIEMCQRVYMDETMPGSGIRHPRFAVAKLALRRVFTSLASRIA
jgi:N-formylglutamate deformylase